jgi:hypothetical protein
LVPFAIVALPVAVSAGVDQWTSGWPAGRKATCVATDPSNSDIVYAGTDSGVLKSTDSGNSWTTVSGPGFDPWNAYIGSIAVDPASPSVLYASVTSAPSPGYSGTVYRSDDASATWHLTGLTHQRADTLVVVPGAVFAEAVTCTHIIGIDYYCDGQLERSEDGGAAFSFAGAGLPGQLDGGLAPDPADPGTLYCSSFSHIYRTENFGNDWEVVSLSPAPGVTFQGAIATGPGSVLYSGAKGPELGYTTTYQRLIKSRDHGVTWVPTGLTEGYIYASISAVVCDPIRPGVLYVWSTFGGLVRSVDGGESFSAFFDGGPNAGVLAIDRSGTRLHAASGGAVYDIVLSGLLAPVVVPTPPANPVPISGRP